MRRLDLYDTDIGRWIQRETEGGRVLTKTHYLESVVSEDALTHCGRRMRRGTGFPFRFVEPGPDPCQNCAEMRVEYADTSPVDDDGSPPLDEAVEVPDVWRDQLNEDDGSTHDELVP